MPVTLRYPIATVTIAVGIALAVAAAAHAAGDSPASPAPASAGDTNVSPIFGVAIPAGYRQWELIAPSQETGRLDELRGILGNAIAMKAYREGTLPFPDGAVLAKLAWKHVPSPEFDGAFVPGDPMTLQIMVKDSKRYVATGGWGFGRFLDGKAVDEAQHRTCFPCHQAYVNGHDFVFTRYAP